MKELRVRLGDQDAQKSVWLLFGILIAMGVLAPLGAWLDGHSPQGVIAAVVFGAFFAGFPIWVQLLLAKAHSRLALYEMISNSEGIRLVRDGNQIWQIAWSEYGGFQESPEKRRKFFRLQENRALSVLNLSRQVIGEIPGFLHSHSGSLAHRTEVWKAIVRELKTKSPSHIKSEVRLVSFRNATLKSAITSGLIGAAVSIPPGWILREVLSFWRTGTVSYPWVIWFAESGRIAILLIPLLVGLTIGIWGISALLLKKASIAEAKSDLRSVDVDQHRLTVLNDGGKSLLSDGDYYEYVDPDWISNRLNQTIVPAKTLVAMVLVLTVFASVVPQDGPPPPWGFWVGLALFELALIGACLVSIRTYSQFQMNIQDRFLVSGDQLIVGKPSGEEFAVNIPEKREFRLPAQGQFSIKTFPREGGGKYRIDPTYLKQV